MLDKTKEAISNGQSRKTGHKIQNKDHQKKKENMSNAELICKDTNCRSFNI